jgi:hypothetical protein
MASKTRETLTMNRSGEFQVKTLGDHHCGLAKILDVKYHMVCVCTTDLDRRGFLFDQVNVDNYFKSIRQTEMSCEQLVLNCSKSLILMILEENPQVKVHSIDLTLSPAPFLASMTHGWKNITKASIMRKLESSF